MLNIIERLDHTRFAPSVCVLQRGGNLDHEVERLGIPLLEAQFTVPARPFYNLPMRARRAAQVFRPYGYSIWHSFNWSSDYTEPMVARLSGAKAWIYTKKSMNWDRRAWHVRTLLATRVVARNHTMVDRYFNDFRYRSKARLVQGGVDTARFSMDAIPHLRLREQFAIPQNETVVACVAQLVRVKGHATLIRAAARIKHLHVWLVGKAVDVEYTQSLRELVAQLNLSNRVHFCDHVSDIPALLAEADLFVLPTWARDGHEEGCPVALLEAMAAGKCCIATDVAGSRDLIENGRTGVLVHPESVDQLTDAIVKLIASPEMRQQFGHEARRRVEIDFTLQKESSRMQAVYEELI